MQRAYSIGTCQYLAQCYRPSGYGCTGNSHHHPPSPNTSASQGIFITVPCSKQPSSQSMWPACKRTDIYAIVNINCVWSPICPHNSSFETISSSSGWQPTRHCCCSAGSAALLCTTARAAALAGPPGGCLLRHSLVLCDPRPFKTAAKCMMLLATAVLQLHAVAEMLTNSHICPPKTPHISKLYGTAPHIYCCQGSRATLWHKFNTDSDKRKTRQQTRHTKQNNPQLASLTTGDL